MEDHMKVTKYEHACLLIEEQGQFLIIDPGIFATSLPTHTQNVCGVVITHQHADHLDKTRLEAIVAANPDVTLFAPKDVLAQLEDVSAKKIVAKDGANHTVSSFQLEFYGKDHAIIYEKVPCENIGVMVNKTLYYPGDSFTEPKTDVKLLALPNGAPWMKISEAMTFMKQVMPRAVFPTHNALYSEAGTMISNNWLEHEAKTIGAAWSVLEPSDSIEM